MDHAASVKETRTAVPNILVIEDDPEVRELLKETLETLGYEVTTVSNPLNAPSVFLRRSFDLITLDYDMPGMNGRELHRLLSEEFGFGRTRRGLNQSITGIRRSLPPILLVTGHAEKPEVEFLQFGESIVGIIAKPFTIRQIREAVEDTLAHYAV